MKSFLLLLALVSVPAFAIDEETRMQAATATAESNPLCKLITPYYWVVGNHTGPLGSGSVGGNPQDGTQITSTTKIAIASASKIIYGTYVVQLRGSVAALTQQDISFLHFTSGYTNIINSPTDLSCPNSLSPYTVNQCLTMTNVYGVSYAAQDPATVGIFDYDGGHMENHAHYYTGLGAVDASDLGSHVQSVLGTNTGLNYSEPLMSGGITATAQDIGTILQHIVTGQLAMHDALGTNAVCTKITKTCQATTGSPIPEEWHYSIGHWVEDDPTTNGDGAFSSPGEYGFYPWVGAKKELWGMVARSAAVGGNGISQQGYASAQCGRLIRHAWVTGVQQTGSIPTLQNKD